MTSIHFCSIVYLVAEVNTSQHNKCDSGVVGNARPCQGRDRGFEPRLSLSGLRVIEVHFFLEKSMANSRRNKKSIVCSAYSNEKRKSPQGAFSESPDSVNTLVLHACMIAGIIPSADMQPEQYSSILLYSILFQIHESFSDMHPEVLQFSSNPKRRKIV